MKNIYFLQMNEINFDLLKKYSEKYNLSGFLHLLSLNKFLTTSEKKYENLEPWIQWVSFYKQQDFAVHKIFRLGDNFNSEKNQFFGSIPKHYRVGCVAPMNYGVPEDNITYFLPDPWSKIGFKGNFLEKKLSDSISHYVNNNSSNRFRFSDTVFLLLGLIAYGNLISKLFRYTQLILSVLRFPQYKAIFLDYLLVQIMLNLNKKYSVNFSSVFLNCVAHFQHHYMLSSEFFSTHKLYKKLKIDPIKEVLIWYNRIIEELLEQKHSEIILVSGLSQKPFENPIYYWRLRDHSNFLNKLGIHHKNVEPRMTRDFLILFDSISDLSHAKEVLTNLTDKSGENLFLELDVREDDLSIFCTLTYPHDINSRELMRPLKSNDFVFVAVKNADHSEEGFMISSIDFGNVYGKLPIDNLAPLILNAL